MIFASTFLMTIVGHHIGRFTIEGDNLINIHNNEGDSLLILYRDTSELLWKKPSLRIHRCYRDLIVVQSFLSNTAKYAMAAMLHYLMSKY